MIFFLNSAIVLNFFGVMNNREQGGTRGTRGNKGEQGGTKGNKREHRTFPQGSFE